MVPILIWFLITIYQTTYKAPHDNNTQGLWISASRLFHFFTKRTRCWAARLRWCSQTTWVFKQEIQNQAQEQGPITPSHSPSSLFSPMKASQGKSLSGNLESASGHRPAEIHNTTEATDFRCCALSIHFEPWPVLNLKLPSSSQATSPGCKSEWGCRGLDRDAPVQRSILSPCSISTLTHRSSVGALWRRQLWWK